MEIQKLTGLYPAEAAQPAAGHTEYVYQRAQRWVRMPNPAQHSERLVAFRDGLLELVRNLPNLAGLELHKTVTSRGVADGINFLVLCLYGEITGRKNIRNPASADAFIHFLAHNHKCEQVVSRYIVLRHAPFYGGLPTDEMEVLLNLELLCNEVYGESLDQVFACSEPVCLWDQ